MAGPIDAVTAIHNAFRRDIAGIDAAALAVARGRPEAKESIARYRFFNEVLVWHARGEELAIFPALEEVAPLVAWSYEKDHRELDGAFESLDAAVTADDDLAIARATAVFKFHLDVHLDKEDQHVYRLIQERVPVPDQGKAVGVMAAQIPPDRQPDLIAWLYPLIGDDDRENMLRIQQLVLPPEVFAGVAQLVRRAVGDDWTELTRRIPGLPE